MARYHRHSSFVWTMAVALLILVPTGAWAVCTAHGTATSTPSQVAGANDIAVGRRYLFIQNTGTSPMNFAIGTNNQATTADILLGPGVSMLMNNYGAPVPSGDISVVSPQNTTWAFCDY
jgi:hypothetical protein